MSTVAGAGCGGNGDGNGGGKKQKTTPSDKISFAADQEKLLTLLLALLAVCNIGTPPPHGNFGKMRNWVDGHIRAMDNRDLRHTAYSPGARSFAEFCALVKALGPQAYDWLIDFLNTRYDTSDSDSD